jgi:hypothetical protein
MQGPALDDEVARLWPRHTDLRPFLLRLLAENCVKTCRDDQAVAKLANEFGPIDESPFARFLDDGPRSVELAPMLWPALHELATPFEIPPHGSPATSRAAARALGWLAHRLEPRKTGRRSAGLALREGAAARVGSGAAACARSYLLYVAPFAVRQRSAKAAAQ